MVTPTTLFIISQIPDKSQLPVPAIVEMKDGAPIKVIAPDRDREGVERRGSRLAMEGCAQIHHILAGLLVLGDCLRHAGAAVHDGGVIAPTKLVADLV